MSIRISEYLKLIGKRKPEFCREIGCSLSMLNYIIRGIKRPGPQLARRIVKATNKFVTYEDLLEKDEFQK